MKDFVLFSLVFTGCLGFVADYWWIEDLVAAGVFKSSPDLWIHLFVSYLVLLVPPYIMMNDDRRESAELVASAVASSFLGAMRWISIGALVAIGFYIFNTAIGQ